MSRHEGVSCDACLKANFRGRRYKCLICYDYDLCSSCYESGSTTSRHTAEHPMQCILTRHDFDIFHGGEALTADTPQSLTCPFCCKMGFTETTLQEHVAATHPDTAFEVVCPICASVPGGDPNHVTDEFAAHLSLDHRSGGAPRELDVSESSGRQGVRRMTHQTRGLNRGVARQNMRFGSVNGGFFSSSPRESMDPIAELLSQLSGVRRATATTRQQQQLERLPARRSTSNRDAIINGEITSHQPAMAGHSNHASTTSGNNTSVTVSLSSSTNNAAAGVANANQFSSTQVPALVQSSSSKQSGQQNFLLSRLVEDLETNSEAPSEAQSRASFIQELLLSTLSDLSLGPPPTTTADDASSNGGMKGGGSTEEEKKPSIDVSTQTLPSSMVPLSHSLTSPPNVPLFSPISKSPASSVPPFNKKNQQKMVVRGSTPLQLQPQNGANQSRGGNPTVGGRGGAKPQSGGAVSPSSNRRKPFKNLDGGKTSQPPPPH